MTTYTTGDRFDYLMSLAENEFLQPYLYRGTVYIVTDSWGDTHYATEYHVEDSEAEIEVREGFLPYVAANGYMDHVDLGLYETEAEAIEAMIEYYEAGLPE